MYDLRFWNEEEGLSCDTWNTEFTVLDDYRGLNANMHTVEAFLAAADVTGEEKYRVRAGRIIDHVKGWAASQPAGGFRSTLQRTGSPIWTAIKEKPDDPFKPYGATPGHGIEWARLIAQWALSTYPKKPDAERAQYPDGFSRKSVLPRSCGRHGMPTVHRASVYTTDWDGKPVVHDRMHWTLAEAINTSSVLYRVTGKQRYADDYAGSSWSIWTRRCWTMYTAPGSISWIKTTSCSVPYGLGNPICTTRRRRR